MWGRLGASFVTDGRESVCGKPARFYEEQRFTHRKDSTSGLQAEWVTGPNDINVLQNSQIKLHWLELHAMSFTVVVNLWRIFKAVETLGGYDSVSNCYSYDYETSHVSVRKMDSGSNSVTGWFQPQPRVSRLQGCWVFLACLMLLTWDALPQKQLIAKRHERRSRSFRLSVYRPRWLHCVWEKKLWQRYA